MIVFPEKVPAGSAFEPVPALDPAHTLDPPHTLDPVPTRDPVPALAPVLDDSLGPKPSGALVRVPGAGSHILGSSTDTETLGDEIARLAAHLHAATYHLLVLIRAFDEREGWGCGFLSCAHWLSWRTGISPGPAREKVRVARALASLPRIGGSMARGELSYSKVRALTRVATPENEEELLEVARHATAAHVEILVRGWRRVDRLEGAEQEERRHQSRFLRLYADDDGTYVLRGRLDADVGALLEAALEWAGDQLYREEVGDVAQQPTTTFQQRRADALGLVAERAMAERPVAKTAVRKEEIQGSIGGDASSESGRTQGCTHRFQVVLHVEKEGLRNDSESGSAFLAESGLGVPAETSRRVACDASVVLMTHDEDGKVLNVGRKRRTVPPAIRRALDHRDGGCRFPGCSCRYTDAHHILHWADGGDTIFENLVLLCRRHHRMVHEEGFGVEMMEGGVFRFLFPDGVVIPAVPEPPTVPGRPVVDLVTQNVTRGINPDSWTATPLWNGETLDYGLAIDMLRRERRGSEIGEGAEMVPS